MVEDFYKETFFFLLLDFSFQLETEAGGFQHDFLKPHLNFKRGIFLCYFYSSSYQKNFLFLSFCLLLCFILETIAWELEIASHIRKLFKSHFKIVQPNFGLHISAIFV